MLGEVPRSHIKSLVSSIRALKFEYCDGTITLTWSKNSNPTDSSNGRSSCSRRRTESRRTRFQILQRILLAQGRGWARTDRSFNACHQSHLLNGQSAGQAR